MPNGCYSILLQIRTLLATVACFFYLKPVAAQEYNISKLKLFPDRDEVLIKDVARDGLGFIWFLTNGEIYRFDGYRSLDILKTIADQELTDDMPQRILVDHRNRLWMAGNANLSYLDLKTWKVHTIASELLPPPQSRSVSWIKQLADSVIVVAYENGHLLFHQANEFVPVDGLYKQSAEANSKISPRSLTCWNGKYWIGTTAGTLLSVDPSQGYQTQYYQTPGLHRQILNLIANPGGLIVNVFPDELYQMQKDGQWKPYTPENFDIAANDYYVLGEGKQMHVYADTKSAFILDHDLRLKRRIEMPLKNNFGPKHICIAGDEAILGTEEGIFVVYPKTRGLSQFISPTQSANKSTRGIYAYPDGAFFFSTYQGAGFVESDGTVYPLENLRHPYVLYPISKNELFVGTEGGFLKVFDRKKQRVTGIRYTLTPEAQKKYAFNLPVHVMSIAETDSDYLIGSAGGLWLLDKHTYVLRRFEDISGEPHGLDLQIRHILLTPEGAMLLSTNVGLLEVQDGKLTKRYPLSGNLGVYKTVAVADTLWVATQGKGLAAIDAAGRMLQKVTTDHGLSNNLVYSLEHTNGILIAGTADGLNLIRGRQIRRIGAAEGLSQSEFNSGASFLDKPGKRVFVGGLMGYTVLDITQPWFENRNQLESYVTEIRISGRKPTDRTTDYTWPYRGESELILKPGQSLMGLYVGTPGNHRAADEVSYQVNNGTWEPLKVGQFISLIEPLPGEYRLRLKTKSTDLEGSTKEVIVNKHPHYYETWWFRTLTILIAMSSMLAWYRSRIRKLQREQAIRNRIAADLHDEVGSSLTRICFQADALSLRIARTPDENAQLKQIAEVSRQGLLSMSDMVWSIDSRFDTMKDLVIRMKDYVYRLREEIAFTYQFDVPDDVESRPVSQMVRQNLFLIFKESMTNALKYGDGSQIVIKLRVEPDLQFVIANRYVPKAGFLPDHQGGQGIANMQRRATKMGGTLTIADKDGYFELTLFV